MKKLIKKISFWLKGKRLGPDMPLTYPFFFSRRLSTWLCKRYFKNFGKESEFRLGAYAVETHKIFIGDCVVLRPGTMLFASPLSEIKDQIVIEDFVLIGSGVHVYVSNHEYRNTSVPIFHQGHQEVRPVIIKRGAWIGANSIILPGVCVGENSVVGAGSIVTKDVPEYSVVVGNPARVVKRLVGACGDLG